jgi:hypothetical protein
MKSEGENSGLILHPTPVGVTVRVRAQTLPTLPELWVEKFGEAPLSDYRENVPGNHQAKLDAIDRLVKQGIVKRHGVPQSKTNPLRLCLINPNWSNGVIVTPQSTPSKIEGPKPVPALKEFIRCATDDGEPVSGEEK